MKSKKVRSGYIILTTLLCVLTFFSCKKEVAALYPGNDLSKATMSLEGTKLIGSITIVTEDKESAIVFNSADKLVIIGIPQNTGLQAGTIKSAELIVSKYGVVIKDISNNEVWLLANNDEKSKRKIESVKGYLPNAKITAAIFDVMEINTATE